MQNVLKRKNWHLEGFQVILNLVLQNHTFYAILNLFICISKNYFEKKTNFLSASANTGFAVRAWVGGCGWSEHQEGRGSWGGDQEKSPFFNVFEQVLSFISNTNNSLLFVNG